VTGSADNLRVDAHVHIVGNGSGGTGCWFKQSGLLRLFVPLMLRQFGLPASSLHGDLDRLYVDRLLELVRGSSIDRLVILAQENVYDENGDVMEGKAALFVPNEYVLRLAREHEEFLAAVSIHPARRDAMDELERCLEGGAVMMKCLPLVQNIDCNNQRYTSFWERMAEAGLPLLAHTGGEATLPNVAPKLADPRTLELPLQCGVTVIAAHCATRTKPYERDYFNVFAEMLQRYPNLYGDNSALLLPFRSWAIPESLRSGIVERLVHGSDAPVPVDGLWVWLRGQLDWKTRRRLQREPNMIERDYQLKRALGYPEETFTRVNRLMRRR
jgi:hypothetical protein